MENMFYFKINLNKYGEMRLQAEHEKKVFINSIVVFAVGLIIICLLYTSPSPRDRTRSRMPSSA